MLAMRSALKDVNDFVRGNPRFRDVINHLSVAFINMKEAHEALIPVGRAIYHYGNDSGYSGSQQKPR